MRSHIATLIAVILLAAHAPDSVAQSDPFDRYATRPDQWRPASPSDPGVDARGDLSLNVPVLTVPGRAGLDFPIELRYTSGIRYADRGSWVGTGWRFDPGSITRDVFGVLTTAGPPANVDFADVPAVQPDAYYITLPGAAATMVRQGGAGTIRPIRQDSSGFYLTEWRPWRISARTASPVAVSGQQTLVDLPGAPPASRSDYRRFVITTEDGTRYVFDHPTLATYYGINANLAGRSSEQYVATWRLVAVLGPYYRGPEVPTGGEPGSWIKLVYGDGTTPGAVISHVAQAPEARPDGADRSPLAQGMVLMEIVTPTHRAVFATAPRGLENFSTWEQQEAVTLHRRLVTITLFPRIAGSSPENNRVVRRVSFEPMATGFPSLGTGERRLALGRLRVFGRGAATNGQPGPEEPGYWFDYYRMEDEGGDLNTTDDFGYYTTRPWSHGFDGDVDDGKAWSLRTIIYPTGGWDEFEYENDYIQPANVSYGRYNAATGGANQAFYAVGSNRTRQGGTRLLRMRRFDAITNHISAPVGVTTQFAYGTGRLTSPPPLYWQREFGFYRLYVAQERGSAAVFYDAVERITTDGARVITRFTTPGTQPAVRQVETVVWDWPHQSGGPGGTSNPQGIRAMALAQGNQGWTWGHPYEVEYRSPARAVRRVTRTFALQGYEPLAAGTVPHLATAWTTGVQARIEWSYGPRLLREDEREIGTTGLLAGPSTVYAYFDQRGAAFPDGSTGTGLVRSTTSVREDGRLRRTLLTYGCEVYAAAGQMVAANRLAAVVRQDLIELDATETIVAYHSSRASRWREVDASPPGQIPLGGEHIFAPFDEYEWTAPQATSARPEFTAWGGGSTSAAWQRVSSNESYDTHGMPLRVLDARGFQTSLTYDNAGRVVRVERDTGDRILLARAYTYSADLGLLTSETDENGARATYAHDERGRLIEVRDRSGAVSVSYAYLTPREPDGRMDYLRPDRATTTRWTGTSPDRNITVVFFDGLGRQIQRQVLDDGAQYIVHGTRYLDPAGVSRRIQERVPMREVTSGNYHTHLVWEGPAPFAPLAEDEPAPLPSSAQNYTETRFVRDGTGRVQGVTFPNEGVDPIAQTFFSHTVSTVAGRNLRLSSSRDESIDWTDTWTDAWGSAMRERRRPTASNSELGLLTETDYDAAGRPTTVRPPNYFEPPHGTPANWVATNTWDTRGRLTRQATPDAGLTLRAYDAAGNLRFEQDPARRVAGEFVSTRYDGLGRPTVAGIYNLAAAGVIDFAQLDPTRPYSETAWENDATRWVEVWAYDRRPSAAVVPWNTFASQIGSLPETFARGRLVAEATRSNGVWQAALRAYDVEGRVTKTVLVAQDVANGPALPAYESEMRYAYDRQGRLATRETRLGLAGQWYRHWYDYSNRGLAARLYAGTSQSRPASPSVVWTHTLADRFASVQFGTAPAAVFTYDVRNRLVRIGGPVGTGPPAHAFQAEYVYTPDGDVAQAAFFQRHVGAPETRDYWAYCYNGYDRLRFAASVPGGLPELTNQCDELWGVTPDTPFSVASLEYDPNGNIRSLARLDASGAVVDNLTYAYVAGTNRIASIADAIPDTPATWDVESGSIDHDANGNVTRLPAPYSLSSAVFDRHDRLLRATSAGSEIQYRYGPGGARYMVRSHAATIEAEDAPPSIPGVRFAHPARAHELAGRADREAPDGRDPTDAAERVNRAGQEPGARRTFAPRFAAPPDPSHGAGADDVTFSAIDAAGSGRPAAVRAPDGSVSFNLLAPDGEIVGRQPAAGGQLYYMRDNLGSIRAVVDEAGAVVESRAYDAWGVALVGRTSATATTTPGFTGKERDAGAGGPVGGLDDFGARSYASLLGRFLQVDPSAADFPGWSPYAYTFNRPASLVDPDGRAPTPMDWFRNSRGDVIWINSSASTYEFGGHTYQNIGTSLLTFDGQRLTLIRQRDVQSGSGRFESFVVPAASGAPIDGAFDYSTDYQSVRNRGPIPEGLWQTGPGMLWTQRAGHLPPGYYGPDGSAFFIDLTPVVVNTYGRHGFEIHPDGGRPGTAGCIGLSASNPHRINQFYEMLRNQISGAREGRTPMLIVDYDRSSKMGINKARQ